MRGSRPISKKEVDGLRFAFVGRWKWRNMALFFVGVNTGFRVSELLSLRIGDVIDEHGALVDRLVVRRGNMKGKKQSRSVLLNEYAKKALGPWLRELNYLGFVDRDDYLFQSRSIKNQAIDRVQAYRVLKKAFRFSGMRGTLGTHAMRKTFANNVYQHFLQRAAKGEPVDAFRATSKALDHTNITSTDQYLSFLSEDIDDAVTAAGVACNI